MYSFNNTLKPLKKKIKQFKIASYDIETDTSNNENNFLMGGFIDAKGRYKSFWDKETMIKYMLEHTDKDTMIYATNNKFDYSVLFKHTKEFLKDKPMLRGGLLMHSRFGHLHFYDTLSYCKASVEKLGKLLKKPKIAFDLSKNTKNMTKWEKRKIIAYNKRDCEISREFMIGFQQLLNLLGGQLKMTIGSCSIDLFRRKYLKENIHHEYTINYVFKDGMTLKEFIYLAYHGGRTEMFKRGTDNKHIYYKYDYNSMYSWAMQEEYPKPSSAIVSENQKGTLNIDTIMKYDGITECTIIVPYMYYPILPIHLNNKLCFPIGKLEKSVFTNIELREAIKKGCIITHIYKTLAYTKTFKPFKNYVTDLYKYKEQYTKENNEVYREVIKLLLNNLYGKFGQHNLQELEFFNNDERNDNDISQEGIIFDEQSGFGYRETPIDKDLCFVIPIFAVHTTALSRIKLYRNLVKLKGIYCDTDSIFSRTKIGSSTAIGELKLEGTIKSINIVKQKHYHEIDTDGKQVYKIKGLRLDKDEKIREQQFNDSIDGKDIKQKHMIGIKEAIRRGKKINEMIYITKKFDLKDTKRTWIRPYNKNMMRDSKPIIIGYKNVEQLMKDYNLFFT